jgi:hypothetical protein
MKSTHNLNFYLYLRKTIFKYQRTLILTILIAILMVMGKINLNAQTPGFIYKQSSTTFGKSILDPNGDGYTSPTNAGFSGTDYGTGSELRMIPIPVLMGEPLSDLNTGGSGGHTDIANFTTTGQSTGIVSDKSVFILKRTVGGVDYLILRYRVGGASTATKGYSVLFDTDGQFGTIWNGNNPGFDREVVYETGTNGRVAIYKHENGNAGQLLASYNVHEYSQRSVALSNAGGDADYFYDFFIPLAALDATSPVRFAAATITSAGSGITGTVSDFNGVDDKLYGNNQLQIMSELITIFPAVTLADLDENFNASGWKMKTIAPVVSSGLQSDATSISGTSKEPNGTIIRVYKYTSNFSDSTFVGTTTVNNGTWTYSCGSSCGLNVGQKVFARAYGANKTPSDLSNLVQIISNCSYIRPPVVTGTNSGQGSISYSWTSSSNIPANTIRLRVYLGSNLTELSPSTATYISSGSTTGTATFLTGLASNTTPKFSESEFFGKIEINGCLSDFSGIATGRSTSLIQTPPPTINTNPILATINTPRTINVTNSSSAPTSTLYLYVNGILRQTSSSTVNAGSNIDFTNILNLNVGDTVYARAFGPNTTHTLSAPSNKIIVTTNTLTPAPVITGSYTAGTTRTVSGTSTSPSGTTIILYANGVQIGTTTVDAYGKWSVSGLTLTSGAVLTAKATEPGKLESPVSNSVTVLPPPPLAPVITTSSVLANTTTSISGTISGNTDSIVLYVDGIRIGSCIASGGNWTLNGINPFELYKGADITAVNFYQGSPSAPSNIVIPIAPDKFDIKDANGNTLGSQTAGVDFNIDVTAQYSNNSTFTQYNEKNMFSSGSTVTKGGGPSANFNTGFLNNHTLNLTKAGNFTITTMSENDPSIVGATSVTVNPGPAAKLTLITPSSNVNPNSTNFATQPVVAITDAFGNVIFNDANSGNVTVSIEKQNGSGTVTATLSGTATAAFPTTGGAMHTYSGLSLNQNGLYILKFTPTKSGISPVYDTLVVANTKIWYGYVSTAFNNADNWVSSGTGASTDIPATGDNVQFHTAPGNPCLLDQSRTLGSIIIASNADATKSYFDLNGNALTLQGDFTLSNLGKIKSDGTSSHLIMAGNRGSAQNLPKDRFLNDRITNLTMNNPNGVTLGGTNHHLKISNSMTFTSGVLYTQATNNCIQFEDGATQPIGSDASHIDGKCGKIGNDAFIFPIGKNGKYAPCGISAPSATTDMFCAEYFPINYVFSSKVSGNFNNRKINNGSTLSRELKKVSSKEYWEIDRHIGTSAVDVSLYWSNPTFSEIYSLTGLIVAHFDKTLDKKWENTIGNGNVIHKDGSNNIPTDLTVVPSSGSVTLESVNDFSPFTFGDEDNQSLTPLNLLTFTGKATPANLVNLEWQAEQNVNSKQFEVYRSNNGITWENLATINANNNQTINHYKFTDINPSDVNLYKLKMINNDGTFIYSQIVNVNIYQIGTSSKVFPNPSNGIVTYTNGDNHSFNYQIIDSKGRVITKGYSENPSLEIELNKGIYFMMISNELNNQCHKIIIE